MSLPEATTKALSTIINNNTVTSIQATSQPALHSFLPWSPYTILQHITHHPLTVTLTTFSTTFISIFKIITSLGFGAKGIIAGSLAAAHQSAVFGAIVPAGSYFASLTIMGMLGTLATAAAGIAAAVAALVAGIVWGGIVWVAGNSTGGTG